jgi:hypothetical protein
MVIWTEYPERSTRISSRLVTAFWVVLEVISEGSPTSLRIPRTSTVASFSTSPSLESSTKLKRACGIPIVSSH